MQIIKISKKAVLKLLALEKLTRKFGTTLPIEVGAQGIINCYETSKGLEGRLIDIIPTKAEISRESVLTQTYSNIIKEFQRSKTLTKALEDGKLKRGVWEDEDGDSVESFYADLHLHPQMQTQGVNPSAPDLSKYKSVATEEPRFAGMILNETIQKLATTFVKSSLLEGADDTTEQLVFIDAFVKLICSGFVYSPNHYTVDCVSGIDAVFFVENGNIQTTTDAVKMEEVMNDPNITHKMRESSTTSFYDNEDEGAVALHPYTILADEDYYEEYKETYAIGKLSDWLSRTTICLDVFGEAKEFSTTMPITTSVETLWQQPPLTHTFSTVKSHDVKQPNFNKPLSIYAERCNEAELVELFKEISEEENYKIDNFATLQQVYKTYFTVAKPAHTENEEKITLPKIPKPNTNIIGYHL